MSRINLREFQGVLKSKNENRYKYTVRKLSASRNAYYTILTNHDKQVLGIEESDYTICVWGDKYFASEVGKSLDVFDSKLFRVSVNKFYKEVLSELIRENGQVLVCPNVKGEARLVTAKNFKIDLFIELWEGEQEKWMFN